MSQWGVAAEHCGLVVPLAQTAGTPAASTVGGSVAGSPDRVRASWQKARLAVYEAAGLH